MHVQVPFCGDQLFWGELCCKLGVGTRPVPITRLRRQDVVAAFSAFERPEMKEKAAAMGEEMARESGVDNAVRHFHACAAPSSRSFCARSRIFKELLYSHPHLFEAANQ